MLVPGHLPASRVAAAHLGADANSEAGREH
jgi:hypothetical protein